MQAVSTGGTIRTVPAGKRLFIEFVSGAARDHLRIILAADVSPNTPPRPRRERSALVSGRSPN
jgi:hypothetical protein